MATTFISCNSILQETRIDPKESTIKISIGNVEASVENGRLVFKNDSIFKLAANNFHSMSDVEKTKWDDKNGIISYKEYLVNMDSLAKNESELSRTLIENGKLPNIKSVFLASIINKDRTVQIGDKIYMVDPNEVFQVNASKAQILNETTGNIKSNKNVVTYQIQSSTQAPKNIQTLSTNAAKGSYNTFRLFTSEPLTLEAPCEFWKDNYYFYAEAGVRISVKKYWCKKRWFWTDCGWEGYLLNQPNYVGFQINSATVKYTVKAITYGPVNWSNIVRQGQSEEYFTLGYYAFLGAGNFLTVENLNVVYRAKYNNQTFSYNLNW